MTDFPEYKGMSYEQASREAERLIQRYGWFKSFDRLSALIFEMNLQLALRTNGD
jgi:hypothetical protein